MIKPILQNSAFLTDIRNAPDRELHIWWLGQSGFLLKWQSWHLLIDPYLSDSLTKKYTGTSKPHVRMTERVIDPQRLNFINAVTSSHNHTDHLDGETLIPLMQENTGIAVIIPRANLQFAADRLKTTTGRLTPISVDGEPVTTGPFKIHAIPAAHETLEVDANGDYTCVGYVIEVAGKAIYHSGDCIPYEGLAKRLQNWKINLALLPINGRDPTRGVAGNFSADEAVQLGIQIKAEMTVPCHYEMFEFNTVMPDGFEYHARKNGLPFHSMKCGERLSMQPA